MSEELEHIEIVYFLGIGGIGMSALARYFKDQGLLVCGYDRNSSPLTQELEMEGIDVVLNDSVFELPAILRVSPKEKILVIVTPAVPSEHPQLKYFKSEGFTIKKRSVVLGLISNQHKTIAVAGTHGKTTTSAMIAHLLKDGGHECLGFLGGIAANYNSNILLSDKPEVCVVEADEFDRSFLTLHPAFAIITSMDADHLDIYGDKDSLQDTFFDFIKGIPSGGTLLLCEGLPHPQREDLNIMTYGLSDSADFSAKNTRIENGTYVFDFHYPGGRIENIACGLPGKHNMENAVAAIAIYTRGGFQDGTIANSMASFKGVKRRFESICKKKNFAFIDDYAHHPRELEVSIKSVRELYPNKVITGIFQPHLFSRTRDFADDFAKSLELLDQIILLPIYPAREEPIDGVDSQMLLDKINKDYKKLVDKSELLDLIKQLQPEVLMTLGAGDIDRLVAPVKSVMCQ